MRHGHMNHQQTTRLVADNDGSAVCCDELSSWKWTCYRWNTKYRTLQRRRQLKRRRRFHSWSRIPSTRDSLFSLCFLFVPCPQNFSKNFTSPHLIISTFQMNWAVEWYAPFISSCAQTSSVPIFYHLSILWVLCLNSFRFLLRWIYVSNFELSPVRDCFCI